MCVQVFTVDMEELRVLGPQRMQGLYERIGFKELKITNLNASLRLQKQVMGEEQDQEEG
jgi:hypothetical protein